MSKLLKIRNDQHHLVHKILEQSEQVILGKRHQVQMALCCLFANGHLLVEDIPGMGKTTLVKFLAKVLGLEMQRIQFTNDLLPADIIGNSIFDERNQQFKFHPGPLFSQIVIADELNRATPKTQSACLQAMEEKLVSVDGEHHQLPEPFFVIATQNPREQTGTFSLPESQLDRFMMTIEMGYPDRFSERALLRGAAKGENSVDSVKALLTPQDVLKIQKEVTSIYYSEALLDYLQDLLDFSRSHKEMHLGLSPRAGLALLRAAQSWTYLEGRDAVLPEDLQAVAVSVMSHRLISPEELDSEKGRRLAEEVIQSVPVE